MPTRITAANIEPGSITADRLAETVSGGPKITNVQIANQSYTVLDDTAISTQGGYVRITGSGFVTGCTVLVGTSVATSTGFVTSSFLNAQLPALPAGTYPMYVVNPDGATAIRINAVTYSLSPTWVTGSTLPTLVTNQQFSIQLNATSNTSVVYSLATGSSLPTGVTLSSAGLLSGTVTGINEDTVFSFIIEATDLENQESPRTFTVSITTGDAAINRTVLLLQADRETFITDASDNEFLITPVDNTGPSAFSPYNTVWSNYLPGSSFLGYTNTDGKFDLGTNDFTIEFGIFGISGGAIGSTYQWSIGAKGGWEVNLGATGTIAIFNAGGGGVTSAAGLAPLNTWTTVAITRTGNTFNFFKNGEFFETISSTYSLAAPFGPHPNQLRIGAHLTDGGAIESAITAYISNFRISSIVRYTTDGYTPAMITTSDADTLLLVCAANNFMELATDTRPATVTGTPRVTSFAAFTDSDTATGSGYFDGSGDYLTGPTGNSTLNTALDILGGDYTIEFWIYKTVNTAQTVLGNFTNAGGNGWNLGLREDGAINITHWVNNASTTITSEFGKYNINEWTHIAVVKNGGDYYFYANGKDAGIFQNGSRAAPANGGAGTGLGIGAYIQNLQFAGYYNGYISDLRIVKGIAVYTGNFDPPTTNFSLTQSAGTNIAAINDSSAVSLLTLQNRTGYNSSQPVDLSGVKNIITRPSGTNSAVGSFSPYITAGWSVYLATDRSVSFTGNASTTLDGDFTWEAWVYLTSYVGAGFNELTILTNRSGTSVGTNIDIANSNAPSPGTFGLWDAGSTVLASPAAGDVPLNEWTHLAISRQGTATNNLKMFINGVLKAQTTSTATFFGTDTMYIGDSMYNQQFNNYISNMRLIKGRAVYTTSAVLESSVFSPPTVSLSPTEDTSFLLFRDGSFTIDSGPQRLAITPGASAPIAVPFSPFKPHTLSNTSYSVYFNGTNSYLNLASDAAFGFGTGDFTIEGWWYLQRLSSGSGDNNTFLLDFRNNSGTGSVGTLFLDSAGASGALKWYADGSVRITGNVPPINTWIHIAVVRSSGITKLFVDGSQEGSDFNDSINYAAAPLFIGRENDGTNSRFIQGNISNLRIVKGTAITPPGGGPTAPLTAVSGTSLLACQSPTVVDNSDNAFAITVNGNIQPTKFNPFGETVTTGVEYSPMIHGGSVYFDGNDYLASTARTLVGDFEISFWWYGIATTYTLGTGNVTGSWAFIGGTFRINNLAENYIAAPSFTNGGWHHVCLSRSGGVMRLFLDGVFQGSQNNSSTFTQTALGIGSYGQTTSLASTGYMSDLRIINGTPTYTSAFVPPQAPLSPVPGTTLLTCTNNAAVYDGVGKTVLETAGNARVINGVRKYGIGSMSFDGTGDYLLIPNSTNLQFGAENFTVEAWIYPTASPSQPVIVGQWSGSTGSTTLSWVIILSNDSNRNLRFALSSNGSSVLTDTVSSTAVPLNTWSHIALVRNGNVFTIYLNGTAATGGSYTISAGTALYSATNQISIGASSSGNQPFQGYIDDLRVTKGVARYTLPFDPPGKHLAR